MLWSCWCSRSVLASVEPDLHASDAVAIQAQQQDVFRSQCLEHDRVFQKLLDDASACDRGRQMHFTALCRQINSAFDVAQEQRYAKWLALQKNEPRVSEEKALDAQLLLSGVAESSRDAVSARGLATCDARAKRYLESHASSLARAAELIRLIYEDERRISPQDWEAFALLANKARDARGRIGVRIDRSQKQPLNVPKILDVELPHRVDTARDPPSAIAVPSSPPASTLHGDAADDTLRPVSEKSGRRHTLKPSQIGMDGGDYQTAFSLIDADRDDVWTQSQRHVDHAFDIWTTEIRLLQAELDQTFRSYPCGRHVPPDAMLITATSIIRFRAAELRRSSELQQVWSQHVRDVAAAFADFCQHLTRFDCAFYRAKHARRSPQVRLTSVEPVPPSPPASQHTLMDVPLTASPTERKWDTFLMAQRRRNDLFIRRHSERKAQLQEREADRGQIFERSLTLWQLAATAAERQRTVEFAQALAHAESLWVSSSARRASVGAQVALRLSATFAEAQQAREDAFHLELASRNGDLMEELKSFVEVLEAFGKRLELRPTLARAPSRN